MITFKTLMSIKPLTDYPKQVQAKLPKVVEKNAFEMEAATKTSGDMPVDTGALRDSIQASQNDSPLHWKVDDAVMYGVFQELGTSRGVTAKHFLGGAAEGQADKFFDDVREALK